MLLPSRRPRFYQEGIESGNVTETCRRHGIAPNLYYRPRDEAEQAAKAALWGRSGAAAETEKRPPHPATGTKAGAEVPGDRNPEKRREGLSCGAVHSQDAGDSEPGLHGHLGRRLRIRCTRESLLRSPDRIGAAIKDDGWRWNEGTARSPRRFQPTTRSAGRPLG